MPTWSSLMDSPTLPLLLLVSNILFSLYSTWGGLWRYGYFSALVRLWRHRPHVLPGSENPILKTYTLIKPLDKVLTFSTVLFANITDGSTPQFSLFAFHFSGQWAAILSLIFMDGFKRKGSGTGLLVSMMWLLFMQAATYSCGMPLYGLVTLAYPSMHTPRKMQHPEARNKPEEGLEALPLSIVVGYIIPTFLMAVPFSNNSKMHQWLGGFWQGHPLWIVLVQMIGRALRRRSSQGPVENSSGRRSSVNEASLGENRPSRASVRVFLFAFATAATTHVASLAIVGSRTLFPALFSDWAKENITLERTYQPPPFWSTTPIESMAGAALAFFQYDLYCGSVAAIVWAWTLYRRSEGSSFSFNRSIRMVIKLMTLTILAGPSAGVIYLIWKREENSSRIGVVEDKVQ